MIKAAAKFPDCQSAKLQDYRLFFKGQPYSASELELLPLQIRPSTLASPLSDTTLAFFSRFSMLSNHFPSTFTLDGQQFKSMEQFLVFRRAKLSGKQSMIHRALSASNPVKAKAVLNALKNDHQKEWDEEVKTIVLEGLRAKFSQNNILRNFLCATGQRELGEASLNKRWGIGMTLDNPEVLDSSKWNTSGNLLGQSLMKIRQEFLEKIQPSV